jgi:hypothetical protein
MVFVIHVRMMSEENMERSWIFTVDFDLLPAFQGNLGCHKRLLERLQEKSAGDQNISFDLNQVQYRKKLTRLGCLLCCCVDSMSCTMKETRWRRCDPRKAEACVVIKLRWARIFPPAHTKHQYLQASHYYTC